MLDVDKGESQKELNTKKNKYTLFRLLGVIAYLAIVIGTEGYYREKLFDKSLTVEANIQNSFPSGVLKFFEIYSNIGTAKVTLTIFGILFVFLPLNYSYCFICAIIYSSFFTNFLKIIYKSPRPIWKKREIGISCVFGYGNPSGHSFSSMCVYLSLAHLVTNFNYFYKKTKGIVLRIIIFIVLLIIIALVLFSRIVLGAHSINQVIYGGLLGFGAYFILFFVIELQNLTPKEFYEYMSNTKNKIISILFHVILFLCALFVYIFSNDIDESLKKDIEKELDIKGCKKKDEYKLYMNDGFYQTLSIFGLMGANIGIWILFNLIGNEYKGSGEHVVVFNKNYDVKKFFYRLGLILLSGVGIVLFFAIPGELNIVIVLIFKGALGFFLGLFGIHFLGIYLCVRLNVANPAIYLSTPEIEGATKLMEDVY